MKILIAEDDQKTRTLLNDFMEIWGYETILANDGNQAWQIFQSSNQPLIALLDWIMPGMMGPEICEKVRALDKPIAPYIILLTIRSEKREVIQGLDAGADDYLSKPFNRHELLARIRVGERIIDLQEKLTQQVCEVQDAMAHIKTLQGILPICSFCHKIRNDKESWVQLEKYIAKHSEAQFTHSICPQCRDTHYQKKNKEKTTKPKD